MRRLHLSAGVMLVYWLMLVGGLALFTFSRLDQAHALQGVWLAMLVGTAVGHLLAIRDVRWGAAFVFVLLSACWFVAIVPSDVAGSSFAKVFVAAGLCAHWSLGDRGALAAFWFPTMIWMLSILDRTGAAAMPDQIGVLLLGALALLFVVFLRAREARRVQLWKTVAFEPLAAGKAATVLKEHPGGHIARASWMLLVGSGAFAITAWLAPKLWQTEVSPTDPVYAGGEGRGVLPCCPTTPTARMRVKEYLNLGLGHDVRAPEPEPGIDCRACDEPDTVASSDVASGGGIEAPVVPGTYYDTPGWIRTVSAAGETTWTRVAAAGGGGTAPATGSSAPAPAGYVPTPTGPTSYTPPPSYTPSPAYLPSNGYAAPSAYVPPASASASAPVASPSAVAPPPIASPPVTASAPPAAAPPPAAAAPAAPASSSSSSSSKLAAAPSLPSTPMAAHDSATTIPPSHSSGDLGGDLLRWVLTIAAAVLALKLVALALRPLRRMVTLRHLRAPYWTETVDQRISNYWQLALIGLRDAGWRAASSEEPRAFAARVKVEGLERCAVILERARHGLGVDADDLAAMGSAADAAYASARAPLGAVAKAGAAVRWPLT